MTLRNAITSAVLALLVTTGQSHAAESFRKRPILRIDRVDVSKPPRCRVYVTDLDASGTPYLDRKREKYRLLVDGLPQSTATKIEKASTLRTPATSAWRSSTRAGAVWSGS